MDVNNKQTTNIIRLLSSCTIFFLKGECQEIFDHFFQTFTLAPGYNKLKHTLVCTVVMISNRYSIATYKKDDHFYVLHVEFYFAAW